MFFQNEWVQLEATSFKHLDTDDSMTLLILCMKATSPRQDVLVG